MANLLQFQIDKLGQAGAMLLSPGAILSLPQLAAAFTIAIIYLCYRQYRRRGRIRPRVLLRALIASRKILFTRSTAADLFYYLVNTFAIAGLIGWGLLSAQSISEAVQHGLYLGFGPRLPCAAPFWALRAGVTFIAFLGYELGYYIDHRCKHHIPFLWELHKTHHSAQVLTPLTVFRVHPLDSLVFINIIALTAGAMHGVFTYAIGRQAGIFFVGHANILTVLCIFILAQLQHSQFWIPLRGWAGRLILSPAHHQLHHSLDPAHYNCNLGSFLAIFDLLFGTLNIPPKESPRLKFGVEQGVENPHRLFSLLVTPVLGALGAVLPKSRPAAPMAEPAAE